MRRKYIILKLLYTSCTNALYYLEARDIYPLRYRYTKHSISKSPALQHFINKVLGKSMKGHLKCERINDTWLCKQHLLRGITANMMTSDKNNSDKKIVWWEETYLLLYCRTHLFARDYILYPSYLYYMPSYYPRDRRHKFKSACDFKAMMMLFGRVVLGERKEYQDSFQNRLEIISKTAQKTWKVARDKSK